MFNVGRCLRSFYMLFVVCCCFLLLCFSCRALRDVYVIVCVLYFSSVVICVLRVALCVLCWLWSITRWVMVAACCLVVYLVLCVCQRLFLLFVLVSYVMLFVVVCLNIVLCCALFVICCAVFGVCCLLYVAVCFLVVMCSLLIVVCCLLICDRHLSFVDFCLVNALRWWLSVVCYLLRVT